jgi:hypothetical protein
MHSRSALALFTVVTSLAVGSSGAFAISNQPYICKAASYPSGMPYWFACQIAFASKTDAQTCSINGWQWQVFMVDGPDFANWNMAQNRQTQFKQDVNTGYWTYKMHGTPCKWNPNYRPSYQKQ